MERRNRYAQGAIGLFLDDNLCTLFGLQTIINDNGTIKNQSLLTKK